MITDTIACLNELQSFDKVAFIGNEEYSQELCNFILTLALIWNDTKSIMLFYEHIKFIEKNQLESETIESSKITPFWGEIGGIKVYLEKSIAAIIYELYDLIEKSKSAIESKAFNDIKKQLHKYSRDAWDLLLHYSNDRDRPKTNFNKALLRIRNKIANHYDKKEIFRGYKKKFIEKNNEPYISRGNSMAETRFYFADAAAQDYSRTLVDEDFLEEYYRHFNLTKDSINFAIQNIVETFIQKRSAWKAVKQPNKVG